MFRRRQHFAFEEDIEDPGLNEANSHYSLEPEQLRCSASGLQNGLDLAVKSKNRDEASHKAERSEDHEPEMAELGFEGGRTVSIRSGGAFQDQHSDRFRDRILEDENPTHLWPAASAAFPVLLSNLESKTGG